MVLCLKPFFKTKARTENRRNFVTEVEGIHSVQLQIKPTFKGGREMRNTEDYMTTELPIVLMFRVLK